MHSIGRIEIEMMVLAFTHANTSNQQETYRIFSNKPPSLNKRPFSISDNHLGQKCQWSAPPPWLSAPPHPYPLSLSQISNNTKKKPVSISNLFVTSHYLQLWKKTSIRSYSWFNLSPIACRIPSCALYVLRIFVLFLCSW